MQGVIDMQDGLGGVVIKQNNESEVVRSANKYAKVINNVVGGIPQAKIIAIHGRQATTGAVNDKNVHFFRNGDYLFAHNGIVSAYSGYNATEAQDEEKDWILLGDEEKLAEPTEKKTDEEALQTMYDYLNECKSCFPYTARYCEDHKETSLEYEDLKLKYPKWTPTTKWNFTAVKKGACDSLKFLKSLPATNMQAGQLKTAMEDKKFFGVGLLLDTRQNKGFLFGTREISIQTDFTNYLFFYSYVPESTIKQYKEICGFRFGIDGDDEIPVYELGSGIYEFSFADQFKLEKFLS